LASFFLCPQFREIGVPMEIGPKPIINLLRLQRATNRDEKSFEASLAREIPVALPLVNDPGWSLHDDVQV
jgi:hypothetical protein